MIDFTNITQVDLQLIPVLSGEHCVFLDRLASTLTSGLTWIPLFVTLFVIVVKNNESMKQIGLVLGAVAFGMLLSDGMADGLIKPLVMRLRPLNDPNVAPLLSLVPGVSGKSYSFFSAHASNTFTICIFFSLLVRNAYMTIAMVLWSLICCWTRIYLSMHYPSDIAVGLLWGFIAGEITYILYMMIYRRMSSKLHFITSQYTSTGYALGDVYIVINVLMLTVIFAIIKSLIC